MLRLPRSFATHRACQLDTEAAPQTAARFNISGIPTVILFKAGREVTRRSGALSAQQIIQFVS
ncbi:MAG: thioredoxin family protein [Pirellulaceae bacterium]